MFLKNDIVVECLLLFLTCASLLLIALSIMMILFVNLKNEDQKKINNQYEDRWNHFINIFKQKPPYEIK